MYALKGAGVEIKAFVGRDPEKTAQRAEYAGIPVALTSIDEALALPGVDLVCITTPPHTHLEIVKAAFAAGKHVVCEKAFAGNAEQASEMAALARESGLVHALGHEHRFDPFHSTIRSVVQEGLIGEPRLVTMILNMGLFADPNTVVPAWWGDRDQGGGWLGAHGIHMLDAARFYLGCNFTGLSASLDTISPHGWSAEDSATIHFRAENGASGVIQTSISDMGDPLIVTRIAGTKGAVRIQDGEVYLTDADGERKLDYPPELILHNQQAQPQEFVETTYDFLCSLANGIPPFTRFYQSVVETIQGVELTHPTPFPDFEDALVGQRTLDAVRSSGANGGEWQSLLSP